jgi:spermidine synthase
MAAVFVAAALAGLFLALQITYKWEIPFIKTILKWHVETGIAFAFTGIFHLLWHIPYFFNPYREQAPLLEQKSYPAKSDRQYTINLFLIGFVSTSVQLILMREIINIAGGYELIAGTFLASWLIGSAAGSFAAKLSQMNDLRKINFIFVVSPIVSLALLVFLKRLFFLTGESPGFFSGMIYSLIVLLPCTFISGFSFIRILAISEKSGKLSSGRSFSIETTGGVLAGITISAAGASLLNNYQLFLVVILLFAAYLFIGSFAGRKRDMIISAIVTTSLILVVIVLNPDRIFRQMLLPGIKVERTTDTPYGNITEGNYGGENYLYYDNHILSWRNDESEREENIHYAMLQHPNPEKVLLISGDIGSNLPEVMKYNVKSVTYVERDPVLAMRYGSRTRGSDGILKTESTDALRFIRNTSEKFDVIIVNLPPPSTLLLNRFYTTGFFKAAKEKLNQGGVFMCSPGTGSNYFNAESTILYSSVFNSMAVVFRNVIPIVGNRLFYLASDDTIKTCISSIVTSRGIKNSYVNSDFLSDDLIKAKSDDLLSIIDMKTRQNTLLFPVACFHFQNYHLSMERQQRVPSMVLMIFVFLAPIFSVRRSNLIMYSSAAALAGFEIIMLLILQSSAGNMYQFTGIILAGFMAGLALGSGMRGSVINRIGITGAPVILILFYLFTAIIAGKLININSFMLESVMILLLSLVPSFLTGRIFMNLTVKKGPGSASAIYSADMAGAALGFIAVSGIAVPLLGIKMTLILLSALIFTGVLFGTVSDK